jgi:acetyl-CoA carboxylase biotin carboxyl carrier protein
VSLDLNALRELLDSINQTDITELTLKSEDFELTVRRESRLVEQVIAAVPSPQLLNAAGLPAGGALDMPRSAEPAAVAATAPPAKERRLLEITSPMVGTFYQSPAPDEPPFVDVGDRVRQGQTVCIIEAMKLMNELESEVSGEIVEVLVQNGQPVEYGQTLMRVNPG